MSRLVSLSDKAYSTLLGMKGGKESFSDVVLKLAEKKEKKSILKYAGKWSGDKKELDRIYEEILKRRQETRSGRVKL